MIIGSSSKSIWVIKLSFCQNDSLIGESFWRNNSLVTHILFEIQPIIEFLTSLLSYFVQSQIWLIFIDNIKQITKVESFLPWIESKMNAWTLERVKGVTKTLKFSLWLALSSHIFEWCLIILPLDWYFCWKESKFLNCTIISLLEHYLSLFALILLDTPILRKNIKKVKGCLHTHSI